MTRTDYIETVAKAVQKFAPEYGICVYSPIIAQACLESGYGTSYKAVKYNNVLGLKWRKDRVTCNSGTFTDGGSEQNPDGSYTLLPGDTIWYAFDSIESCIKGYFQFISISNYSSLKGETDPYEYLKKIKAAGYATSLNYVDNVYKVITSNNLTKYDPKNTQKTFKVAIDAGHGSETAGKRHPDGYREHYSNVYIAYYLNQILTKNGIETLKVSWDDENAKDDTDVALTTRQNQVKAFGADISVSIHGNAFGDGKSYNSAQGVETLYHSDNSKAGDSKALADMIQKELIKGTPQSNRGVKRQTLAMCNCTAMGVRAAVLVEVAFMTNKEESELLKSDLFWRECAREIAAGIFNYLGVTGNTAVSLTSLPGTVEFPNTEKESTTLKTGQEIKIYKLDFYANSTAKTKSSTKTGNYWVWSNVAVNGRIRMTNAKSRVGISGMITGWVNESELTAFVSTESTNSSSSSTSKTSFVSGGLDYSPIFNPVYYSNTYADLKKAYGTNSKKLFDHFIKYGMKEGRRPCEHFSVQIYKARYADLRKAFGDNLPEYYKHFIKYGLKEGRKPY